MYPDSTQLFKPEVSYTKGSIVVRISAYKGAHKHGTYSVLLQYYISTFWALSILAMGAFGAIKYYSLSSAEPWTSPKY
jgi:hypothetical protein